MSSQFVHVERERERERERDGGRPIPAGREPWIDVARGIAILLVVLGHSIGVLEDPLNRFILSFHMPLFFFISGLTAKSQGREYFKTFYNKARGILIPQVTLAMIWIIFGVLIEGKALSTKYIIGNLFSWFLVVLFYTSTIFLVLQQAGIVDGKSQKRRLINLGTLIILVAMTQLCKLHTFAHIETIPAALFFYLSGYYIRPKLDKARYQISEVNKAIISWYDAWVFAVPVVVICSYWNSPIKMYANEYGNLPFFFATAIGGIWTIVRIAQCLSDNKGLAWFGKNSVIIYIFHPVMLKALHGIGKLLIPKLVGKNYEYPAHWHYFMIVIVLLIPVVYICNRWLWFLFGKRKPILKTIF